MNNKEKEVILSTSNKQKKTNKILSFSINIVILTSIVAFLVTLVDLFLTKSQMTINLTKKTKSANEFVDKIFEIFKNNDQYSQQIANFTEFKDNVLHWITHTVAIKNTFVISNIILELAIIILILILIKKFIKKVNQKNDYKLSQLIAVNLISIISLGYVIQKLFIPSAYGSFVSFFITYKFIHLNYIILLILLSVIVVNYLIILIQKIKIHNKELNYSKFYTNIIKPIFLIIFIYAAIAIVFSTISYAIVSHLINQINFVDWINITNYLPIDFSKPISEVLPSWINDILTTNQITLGKLSLKDLNIPNTINNLFDKYVLSNINTYIQNILQKYSGTVIFQNTNNFIFLGIVALITNYSSIILNKFKFYGYLIGSIIMMIIIQTSFNSIFSSLIFYALLIGLFVNVTVIVREYSLITKIKKIVQNKKNK